MGTPLLIKKVICFFVPQANKSQCDGFSLRFIGGCDHDRHWKKNWKSFMGAEYLSSKVCG
jgi:hypothetical protein